MTTPWTFGWTQLLTFAGLVLTGYIGYQGLRTFDRWRREKIEEKRIDVALDALSTAYKSKYVFEYIRSPLVRSHEFADMPGCDDGKENRKQGEAPYAILKHGSKRIRIFSLTCGNCSPSSCLCSGMKRKRFLCSSTPLAGTSKLRARC
jgi:hypothetical protein